MSLAVKWLMKILQSFLELEKRTLPITILIAKVSGVSKQSAPPTPAASPRYVLLFNVDDAGVPKNNEFPVDRTVSIRTFGYFDVFVGDKPIAFRNKKSKELFALLVDRRGGYVSSEDAISFLWEDEPVNSVTLARYRKVALRLKNILAEYGISDVVESVDGKRRIVTEKVQCDLFDYLSGKEEYSQLFKGSYLTNYSWGENTLAELHGKNFILTQAMKALKQIVQAPGTSGGPLCA